MLEASRAGELVKAKLRAERGGELDSVEDRRVLPAGDDDNDTAWSGSH